MSRLPVRVSTLKDDIELGFNLYLQLPHKSIKYVHHDDAIAQEQIKTLKSKKVRKLYIEDEDEPKYQEYMDRCLNATMDDDNLSTDDKAQVVVDSSENNAEKIMDDPQSQRSYKTAQNTAQKLIDVLGKNDELLKSIFDRKSENDDDLDAKMHKHAVNTSSLCISFAEFIKLDEKARQNLGIAGLFHDVAYGQWEEKDKLLFFKDIEQMQAPELTQYKLHPKQAAEYLQDKDFASKEVIELILSHEERQGGNGFPNKLKKLSSQQEVLALCAYYDRRLTCLGEDRKDVLKDLAVSQLGNFELDTINKFKEFIKKSGLKD